MNAFLMLIFTDAPSRELPTQQRAAATVARHFRRLTHAERWENLLTALLDRDPRRPAQKLRGLIFLAARRAVRLRGLGIIVLPRRPGFLEAPPGPSCAEAEWNLAKSRAAWQMREDQSRSRAICVALCGIGERHCAIC
jgi:hypothetical protein